MAGKPQGKRREIPLLEVMVKETVEPEHEDEHYMHVCKNEMIDSKVDPKRECSTLGSSLAGTGFEHPNSCAYRAATCESFLSTSRYRDETQENYFTSRRLSRDRGSADGIAVREGSEDRQRREQAVRFRRMMERMLHFCREGTMFWGLVSCLFALFHFLCAFQ